MPKKAEVIIWLRRARLSARFRRPFSLVRFFLDEQKEPNEVSSAKPNEHFYIPPQCKHWSVCRNSLNEKDCFACGSAIPGGDAIKQKAAVAAIFCNFYIPPQCKHWSVCRNYKKAVFTAFLFEREKGFEPSTLSLGS